MTAPTPDVECIYDGCTDQRDPDSLACSIHGSDRLTMEMVLSAGKADPVPDEATEEFARDMRMQFTALVRQGFTEDQALKLVAHSITAMLTTALEEEK